MTEISRTKRLFFLCFKDKHAVCDAVCDILRIGYSIFQRMTSAKSRAKYNSAKEFNSEELFTKASSNHSIRASVFNTAG